MLESRWFRRCQDSGSNWLLKIFREPDIFLIVGLKDSVRDDDPTCIGPAFPALFGGFRAQFITQLLLRAHKTEQRFSIIDLSSTPQSLRDQIEWRTPVGQAEHLRASEEDKIPVCVTEKEDWISISQVSIRSRRYRR